MLDKAYRRPREIDPRDIVFDPRPKTAMQAAEEAIQDMKEIPEPIGYQYDRSHANVPESERYRDDPLDRIAELVSKLTYGEMVELTGKIWTIANGEITAESLPHILWDWAKSYG